MCKDPDFRRLVSSVSKRPGADYLRVALAGHVTLPGEDVPDWNECGHVHRLLPTGLPVSPGRLGAVHVGEGRL